MARLMLEVLCLIGQPVATPRLPHFWHRQIPRAHASSSRFQLPICKLVPATWSPGVQEQAHRASPGLYRLSTAGRCLPLSELLSCEHLTLTHVAHLRSMLNRCHVGISTSLS